MKVKVFAFWHKFQWEHDYTVDFSAVNMAGQPGWVSAGEFELDLDIQPISQAEQTRLKVEELRKQQADLQVKQNELLQQINDLLCLEHVS